MTPPRAGQPQTVDVLVSGGGVAGLTAAVAFGARGLSVLCVDPAPPITEERILNSRSLRTLMWRAS